MISSLKHIRLFSLIFFSLVIVACGSARKQRDKGYQAKKEDSLAAVAKINNLNFQWLKGRFDADADLGNEEVGFNASFRIKKDSVIWISISKLGFNVVKIILTQDTVIFIDKIHGTYYAGNYTFFKDSLKTDVDFNHVQAILAGDFCPVFTEDKYSATTEIPNHVYASPKKALLGNILQTGEFYKGTENINVIFLSMDTSRVERVYYQDPVKQYILDILYLSRQDGSFPFPKKMMIALKSGATQPKRLDIDFSKIEIGCVPLDVSFSIPKDYAPIKFK